jgi:hypothetical protein
MIANERRTSAWRLLLYDHDHRFLRYPDPWKLPQLPWVCFVVLTLP